MKTNEIELIEGRYILCKCRLELFAYLCDGEALAITCSFCNTTYLPQQIEKSDLAWFFCCDECGRDNFLIIEPVKKGKKLVYKVDDFIKCDYCNTIYKMDGKCGKQVPSSESDKKPEDGLSN